MTAPSAVHTGVVADHVDHERCINLEGQAIHVFQFNTPVYLAYEYFLEVPHILQMLPDMLDIQLYALDHYRLVVGATDGHGHAMAAVFDLQADFEEDRYMSLVPAMNGPTTRPRGMNFNGNLWAEAVFQPHRHGTAVEYTVEIELKIPIPRVLKAIPQKFLQNMGERAMSYKMTHMINGFVQSLEADFYRWSHRVA